MEKEEEVKEEKGEENEETQWIKTKMERKKERKKTRQLDEQKEKYIRRNKRDPIWNYRCINCKIMGLRQGCANCCDWCFDN